MGAENSEFEAPLERHRLAKNLENVRQRIQAACLKAARNPLELTLVAVTKTVGPKTCDDLVSLGCHDLAENRPQVLWEKSNLVSSNVRWHFIGHLQRNKSARTIGLLTLMHSLDSMRLSEQIVNDSTPQKRLRVLLEVNITQDQTKTGLRPEQAQEILMRYLSTPPWQERIEICGVMGMSSLQGDATQTHREFENLRLLRDRWQDSLGIQLH